MNLTSLFGALIGPLLFTAISHAVTIDTVPIGNPGNPGDTRFVTPFRPNALGSVGYSFRMGKTETTNTQYVGFLNGVAVDDPYGLYDTSMGDTTIGGIVRSGSPGSYTYAVKPAALNGTYAYGNKPVWSVEPGDAMRFANWLHNGQPSDPQSASTTEDGAYTLNGATSPVDLPAVTRNPGARWWLPSEDEWHKAAYHKNDGVTGNYWYWPTRIPGELVPNNNPPSSDTGNSANFEWNGNYTTGNYDYPLTDAGAYTLSASAYGTFDQGGNVGEYTDTLVTNGFSSYRIARGGSWSRGLPYLSPEALSYGGGFRVATSAIPEPTGITLSLGGVMTLALWRFFVAHFGPCRRTGNCGR